MPVITHETQEIPPFTLYEQVVHGVVICASATAVVVGVLAVLANRGVISAACFAAIGMKGGYVLIGCGVSVGVIEICVISSKQPVYLQVPIRDEKVYAVQREICCAERFLHGENDTRNPLWDTVEEISMMTPGMGAFRHIEPYEDQMDKLWTSFGGTMPAGQVSILWCGHSSFFIKTPSTTLLTDPNWEDSIEFLGPIKGYYRSVAPPCALSDLPNVGHVLVSHTHADHCNVPTLTHFQDKPIYCPSHAETMLEGFTQVHPMRWWEKKTLSSDVEITYLPSDHASQTGALNCNECLWGGYKIAITLAGGNKYNIWFTGDSACNINPGIKGFDPTNATFDKEIFTQIATYFSDGIDLVLCQTDPTFGQEDKHWNAWQSLDLFRRLFAPHFKSTTLIIPMHWGTWPFNSFGQDLLAPLTILQNVYKDLDSAMYERLVPMKVGETRTLVI